MSCPTCSHTMHYLGDVDGVSCHWCPRCGTLRSKRADFIDHEAPKLVGRVLQYETHKPVHLDPLWDAIGIRESIHSSLDETTTATPSSGD